MLHVLLYICILFSVGKSLYEDQVGKFDWRQQYVGEIKYALFDQSGSPNGRRIAVATKQNVLAVLNTKNGDIAWRQVLENDVGIIDKMLIYSNSILISQCGGRYLRSFNMMLGNLNWESNLLNSSDCVRSVMKFRHTEEAEPKQVIVLANNTIFLVSLEAGSLLWFTELPDRDTVDYSIIQSSETGITVVGRRLQLFVVVTTLSYSGKLLSTVKIPSNWIQSDHQCAVLEEVLVCLDKQSTSLRVLSLKAATSDGPNFRSYALQEFGPDLIGKPYSLQCLSGPHDLTCHYVVIWTESRASVLKLVNGELTLLKSVTQATAVNMAVTDEQKVIVFLSQDAEKVAFSAIDAKTGNNLNELTVSVGWNHEHGSIKNILCHVIRKKEGTLALRLATIAIDHSFCLLQQTGRIAWCREESLSSIVATESVDLPVSQIDAEMEEEFGSTRDSIPMMFVNRLRAQAIQLKEWVIQTVNTLQSYGDNGDRDGDDDEEGGATTTGSSGNLQHATRDEFNLHKVIIAVTSAGKLFGIDSLSGKIVWRHYVATMSPFEKSEKSVFILLIQRNTAHFPYQPQAVVIGRNEESDKAVVFIFNPLTGQVGEGMSAFGQEQSYSVIQAVKLELMDEHFVHPIVLLDNQQKFHVIPSTAVSLVGSVASSVFLFTADVGKGLLQGYSMKTTPQGLVANPVWLIDLQINVQNITHVVLKNPSERVHSQGHVLADRNVLYKYVNPNLVAVVTEGAEISGGQKIAGQVTLYLIDMVTGHIIFQATQKKAEGPVHVVHSENWIVLSYWSQKSKRVELSVYELYEGDNQSNGTVFSSFAATQSPLVSRQSFIFPGYITAMGVTLTERGMTNKNILFALHNGGLLELPKMLVDARRPVILTPQHREEGVLQYIPELPRPFEATINYNKSVFNIRVIRSFATGLESTSLVIFYGLDVFCVRVTPSRQFDMLKEDFDYFAISSVLIGVIVASVISQKLAARKALQRAWK